MQQRSVGFQACVIQVVDSGLDDQWNQRADGLADDQRGESHNEALLVTGKIWPNWAEAREHQQSLS